MYWMGDATIPAPLYTPLPSLFRLGSSWPLGIQQAGQIQADGELGIYLPLCLGHTALVLEACQAGLLSDTVSL